MSGASQGSISRNCIDNDFGLINLTGGSATKRTDTDGSKYIEWCGKKIYYVGSGNSNSWQKIRGITIGGWYADEVNVAHPSFVSEALNRSLASQDRRNIWTLNPSQPKHFIYTDYIDAYQADENISCSYYHFTMDDNPSITEEARERFARQYKISGVLYYQRFILGLRVNAEGLIYSEFDDSRHVRDLPANTKILKAVIGSDIGGNGSATSYVCTLFYLNDKHKLCVHVVNELYDKKNDSTEKILDNFRDFCVNMKAQYLIECAYTDSAEQLIKKSMNNQGIIQVKNSKKCMIVDRIRLVKYLLALDRFSVSPVCYSVIEALQQALYNDKSATNSDVRLDNGTTPIDPLDALEYSIEHDMKQLMMA